MFRLPLFRIRAFTFGTLSTFLSAIARGGLMFMLIIWLQGIWLPLHGYDFTDTPLWAGIYMLPLTLGMLIAGPTSGYLSDRFGARRFATGGMLGAALSFVLLTLLPIDFSYPLFAAVLFLERHLDGAVRLAEPRGGDEQPAARGPRRRRRHEPDLPELRAGALGRDLLLADDPRAGRARCRTRCPAACSPRRRRRDRRAARRRRRCRSCSRRSSATTRSSTSSAPTCSVAVGRTPGDDHGPLFFPQLISAPFRSGCTRRSLFAIVACLIAAAASLMRGGMLPPRRDRAEDRRGRPLGA